MTEPSLSFVSLLCPYYRGLWNQFKKLSNKQGIFSFFTVNGSIRTKIRENSPYNIITHTDDLKDISPDEDFTMSQLVTYFLFEATVRRSSVKSCSCGFIVQKGAVILAFFLGINIFRQLLGLSSATGNFLTSDHLIAVSTHLSSYCYDMYSFKIFKVVCQWSFLFLFALIIFARIWQRPYFLFFRAFVAILVLCVWWSFDAMLCSTQDVPNDQVNRRFPLLIKFHLID